jgi:predicted O-linked N-acetylglucosamine transferase (SPINDLY family)
MLPFDTLLLPVSLQTRLLIAYSASMHISASSSSPPISRDVNGSTPLATLSSSGRRLLRVGLTSYDFNDHPTSHLVEGIFQVLHQRFHHPTTGAAAAQQKYQLIVFSYGKNDGSTYRLQLERVS